jgi:amino acid adenylation domain-containing protein
LSEDRRAYDYNLGLRFQAVAAAHPDRPALWLSPDRSLSYRQLDAAANRQARVLCDRGVGAGQLVCISGTKTPHSFAVILGCLKIGAVYAVLDPQSPPERLRKILQTCRPRAIIAEPALLAAVRAVTDGSPPVEISPEEPDQGDDEPDRADPAVTGGHAAYVMFTSGSTGTPKGAVMSHANVLNLIAWAQATYGIAADDVATSVNPLYFDNSVFDLYATLFSGACLVPFTREETRDPLALVRKVDAARCTSWFSVPSLLMFLQTMKATDGRRLRSIRRFIFGGEGYPKRKLRQLFEAYCAGAAFYNVYGPTECTCICSSYRVTEADFADPDGLPPLGSIADNFGYLLLGDDGSPVPAGETGELCLLGPNVGLGYYGDPTRTAASFVQNPLNTRFREIMYRTGDLVRWDPRDRKLHIHGRRDNQVKHMGYRVELEEIEAGLHSLPYVAEAVALHSTVQGLSRLTAVVALRESVEDTRLRADLAGSLPEYMIPSVIHRESVLPKNANGKVDRRLLAERYAARST